MAVIKSGDSTDQMHVDPFKAGFINLRKSDGTEAILPGTGLTDTELRATPVPVSGFVSIANFPLIQGVAGSVAVTNFPVSQPVTGTFFQATQPVSGPLTDAQLRAAAVPVSGPLTDAQLRALAVPVSGAFFQATQPVSGPLTDVQMRLTPVPVSGTFFQATQPVSGTFFQATQPVSGAFFQALQPMSLLPGNAPNAQLAVTATGVAGAAVTLTLPAVAAQFHYLTMIEVLAYTTVARVGGAVPIIVTTTNLPGAPAFTFGTAAAVGTVDRYNYVHAMPLRSAVVNTATTIVCPATVSVIWRVNVWYQASA